MYGVSEDLPLASFVGEMCDMIGLGQFQLQFHFLGGRKSIMVEIQWELRDCDGQIVDQFMPHNQRSEYRIQYIIDRAVCGFKVNAPISFTLEFDNGYTLTVYDDNDQYECISIHTDGNSYYL